MGGGDKFTEWDAAKEEVPPLFEEWDDTQLADNEGWSLESAMLEHAGQSKSEPCHDANTFREFVDALDEKLAEDIGYGSAKENIDILARMYIEDKPNYARAEQIIRRHKLLRLMSTAVKARARQLSNVQVVPGGGESLFLVKIKGEMQDAPVHPEAVVPASWVLDGQDGGPRRYRIVKKVVKKRDGEITEEHIGVAYNPVVVNATMINIADAHASLRIAWKSKGKWRHKVVPRDKLAQPRELLDALSGVHGFPANINNVKDVIQYITDYEAFNEEVIPTRPMTTQMGWQKNGSLGFVTGRTHIPSEKGQAPVQFVGADDGDEQLARCTQKKGTLEGWAMAAKIASNFPIVELGLYASLAPALLTPLKAPNFTVDWSHKTSGGKTTTLSLAASCWGDPDPNASNSFIASWDMTSVGFERRAAALSCMPLIVDDTKRAKSWRGESIVPGIVYEISNGQGRIRGSIKGTAKTSYWRTIMLSSGEHRIIDFDKSGGTPARVVTLWGNPFGGTSSIIGEAIRKLKSGIGEHHGHAGPALVEWLVNEGKDWKALREQHEEHTSAIEAKMMEISVGQQMDMSVLGRVAGYLATLQIAAECAHKAMDLPWELKTPILDLLPIIVPAAGLVDRELEALKDAVSWAAANRSKFCYGENSRRQDEPNGGWLGFWEAVKVDQWDRLAFFPGAIRTFLREQGYEPHSILTQWKESGWLQAPINENRLTTRIGELAGRPRMIVLTRKAVVEYGDLDGPSCDEVPF